jgi:pantetheine-phosphate adenylyltransferase
MNICLGGTFDQFHKGHETLLEKAFESAGVHGHVFIGITSDKLGEKKGEVRPFAERKKSVEQFLKKKRWLLQTTIKKLTDAYGPSIDGDFDAIVVSPETKPVAEEINEKRRQRKKKPLQILIIPFVLAEDKRPISSSRIRRKEINAQGTILREE